MNRNLSRSKNVTKYLNKRYGKIHKMSYIKQEKVRENIIKDHTDHEIKFMFEEIKIRKDMTSDLNFLDTMPVTLLSGVMGSFITLLITLISDTYRVLQELAISSFNANSIDVEEFIDLINPSALINLGGITLFVISASLSFYFIFFSYSTTNRRRTNYLYLRILKSCVGIEPFAACSD